MREMQKNRVVFGWVVRILALFGGLGVVFAATPRAAADPAANPERGAERVDLFEAIQAGAVQVTVIPQRAERVTLQFANQTDRPLSIEMPEGLAAAPILAQLPLFPGGQNQNDVAANAPQAVGFPGPNNGGNNNVGAGPGFPFPMNPGIFNVPAGRTIKVKAPAVCLEFGKRSPHSRIAYELKPIDSVNDRPEVVTVLSMIGRKEVDRRIGQLAIWHLANDVAWSELARLRNDRIDGMVAPQYSSREIADAKDLVKKVSSPAQPETSLSRR